MASSAPAAPKPAALSPADRIAAFKECLVQRGVEAALQEHVLQHDTSVLGAATERAVRQAVAEHFGVPIESVCIVGSAKLGFSLKPGQLFRPFSVASDIDVAIVSEALFERIWKEIHRMESAKEYFDFGKFKHYHFHGWIRPDKMPNANYETCRDWWDFFKQLSRREDFMRLKVSGGLYYDDYFLRNYQGQNLVGIREHLRGGAR